MLYHILLYFGLASANVSFKEPSDKYSHLSRDASKSSFQTLWFNQTLDHDNAYSRTFKQKYFVNSQYYKPGGPAFVYIGGEGTLTEGSVLGGNILELAKENNGIVFGLEHRFYGDSQPFEEWTLDNLNYLSSLNGVKDAGNFIKKVTNPTTNKPFVNTKWITVGASYPGSLSAWIRQEYPNDVFIGYASSAPVLAKEDFYEYDQSVASALGPQCSNDMDSIRQHMDDIFTNTQEFNKLKSDFGCGDVEDNMMFLSTYADTIAGIVQYNSKFSSPNIDSICAGLANQEDLQGKLKHIIQQTKIYMQNKNKTCKFMASLDSLKQLKANNKSFSRQWVYQSCQEYGYWQTAPKNGISIRSRRITVDWAREISCSADIFGKKIGPPDTKFINSRFKALNNFTPRTIWVNGDADPWMALSVIDTQNSKPDRPIYLIKKGSHVTDLGSYKPNDSSSLTDTRKNINADISRWLKQS